MLASGIGVSKPDGDHLRQYPVCLDLHATPPRSASGLYPDLGAVADGWPIPRAAGMEGRRPRAGRTRGWAHEVAASQFATTREQPLTPSPRVSVFIVDDEPLARRRLRDLLRHVPWLESVGEAATPEAAIAAIDDLQPDLVFLDVRLPGLSGLDVLSRVKHRPAVIFTTAHDQFAVPAFDVGAIDYLLKPFDRERFDRAIDRVRPLLDRAEGTEPADLARDAQGGERTTRPEPCRRPRSLRQSSGSPEQGRGAHRRPTDGEHDERGSGATESTPTQLSSATRRRNLT